MDVLSEVLRVVRLEGAFYYNAEFSAPWLFDSPSSHYLKPYIAPTASHLIIYHLITAGRAYAKVGNDKEVLLEAGDILVLPHGHPHRLGNGRPSAAIDTEAALARIVNEKLRVHAVGGGGETTRIVCGFMSCDERLGRPVLDCLPPIMKVSINSDASGQWLENSIRFAVDQAVNLHAGGEAVLAKLSEVLFVETLRRYVSTLAPDQIGWLGGARDEIVGRALALLHQKPEQEWTIALLATEVGTSRSVLAERFTHYIGEPPMTYLTRWRLQLGAGLLRSTSRSVLEIAMEVGYQSEAAFNRAFRREFNVPPARYRREQRSQKEQTLAATGTLG